MVAALVRVLQSPITPLSLWLLSFSVVSAISIEHLFDNLAPALQFALKLAAYVTIATTATLGLGMVVTFGLCCAWTLRWLKGPVPMRTVARAVCVGTWSFAINTGITAIVILNRPFEPITADQLATTSPPPSDAETLLGVSWLTEAQYVAAALFLVFVFLSLTRAAGRINSMVAVALAASLVVFIASVLRMLAAALSPI